MEPTQQDITPEVIPTTPEEPKPKRQKGRPHGVKNSNTNELKQLKDELTKYKVLEFKIEKIELTYNLARDDYLQILSKCNILD